MLTQDRLLVPRRLIPALMLLGSPGGTGPDDAAANASQAMRRPADAVAELEATGIVSEGRLTHQAADVVSVMTEPSLVVSVEVDAADGAARSTVWATAHRAVWGRPVESEIYELRRLDPIELPLLLAQVTGVGRRPAPPFAGSCRVSPAAVAAARDWHGTDPETALAILIADGLDPVWADRLLIAHQHRRAEWTVSSVWADPGGGHHVRELTILDAGPAGYWRVSHGDQPGHPVTFAVVSLLQVMELLRTCLPAASRPAAPSDGGR